MSPRARIFLVVGLAAAAASGIVVIGVLATRSNVPVVKPRTGSPPLALDLGVRKVVQGLHLGRAKAGRGVRLGARELVVLDLRGVGLLGLPLPLAARVWMRSSRR